MHTYADGSPMTVEDAEICDRGVELARDLVSWIAEQSTIEEIDCRLLAVCFGAAFGCYLDGIKVQETKIVFTEDFVRSLILAAGVPLMTVRTQ